MNAPELRHVIEFKIRSFAADPTPPFTDCDGWVSSLSAANPVTTELQLDAALERIRAAVRMQWSATTDEMHRVACTHVEGAR